MRVLWFSSLHSYFVAPGEKSAPDSVEQAAPLGVLHGDAFDNPQHPPQTTTITQTQTIHLTAKHGPNDAKQCRGGWSLFTSRKDGGKHDVQMTGPFC